jgi:hypothetical protein
MDRLTNQLLSGTHLGEHPVPAGVG